MSFLPRAVLRAPAALSNARTYVTRPIRRKDPLFGPTATHHAVSDGSTLIHRPPPSAPLPNKSSTAFPSPLLFPSAPPSAASEADLPPPIRQLPNVQLTEAQQDEIRALRAQGVGRNELARRFGCTPTFVSRLAPKGKEAKVEHERRMQEIRDGWGWNKQISREERAKRKTFW